MKKLIALATILAMVSATAAYAGDASSTATTSSSSGSTASNQGNSQAIILNSNSPSTQTVRDTPTVFSPNLTASMATCLGSAAIGASGPGWGASLGSTHESKECNIREDAAMVARLGDINLAYSVLCESKIVRDADKAHKHCQ